MAVFNRAAWFRFSAVAAPFFRSELRWWAFALRDEATRSLSARPAADVYPVLERTWITDVSVVDHACVAAHHDAVLELGEHGDWKTRRAAAG